jgi:hypothetical protein
MNAKRTGLLWVVMLWLCVAVVACGKGTEVVRVAATDPPTPPEPTSELATDIATEVAGVAATDLPASPEPTSEPATGTATEIVNVSPTEPEPTQGVLDDLEEELFVSLGGGDGAFCIGAPPGPLPLANGDVFEYHFGYLCLWGFPAGSAVSVEMIDPLGQLVASREVTVDDERDGVGVVQLLLWFAGQPAGEWTVVANSDGMSLEASFHVSEANFPVVSVMPPGSDLFDGDRWLHWWAHSISATDGQAAIFGAGFPSGRSLPLGIYYQREADSQVPAELVYAQEVQTDEFGRFETHMPVEALASQGDGTYFAIVPLDPAYRPIPGAFDPLGSVAGFVAASGAGEAASMTVMLAGGGGLLDDPIVQQALVAAVNRLHLSDYFGGAQVTFMFSFQGEVIDPAAEPWDPNLARQLLARAGYPEGAYAGFVYPDGDSELYSLAWGIADNLASVGFSAELTPVSPADIDGHVGVRLAAGEPVLWLVRR